MFPVTPTEMETKGPVLIVGLGQLGSLFADAFGALGHRVIEVRRGADWHRLAQENPMPEAVLVTVGEDDLVGVLSALPHVWRGHVVLVQNELRPSTWLSEGIALPTVMVVWFERKNGGTPHAVRESVVAGPLAPLLAEALTQVDLTPSLIEEKALAHELCLKNLYILTLNLCGLAAGGTAGQLLREHRSLLDAVFEEIFTLEQALFGTDIQLDREDLRAGFERALHADPEHATAGRSAPRRLERAREHARHLGISVPQLDQIARDISG